MGAQTEQLTWKDFDEAVQRLSGSLRVKLGRDALKNALIAGMPRGGLPLAVALSHYLDVQMVPFEMATYDDLSGLGLKKDPIRIIVDDIVDTGMTLVRMKHLARYRGVTFVSWVMRVPSPHSRECMWHCEVPHKTWVIFPWEDPTRAAADRDEFLRSRGLV